MTPAGPSAAHDALLDRVGVSERFVAAVGPIAALVALALIGLLMLGLGIFSLVQMGNIRQAGVAIEQVSVPSIKILDELTALNLRMRTLSYRLLLNREPATQRDTLDLLDQRNSQIDRARQAYLPMSGAAISRPVPVG